MLYTVQISAIKLLPPGIEPVDITVKSSVAPWSIFAPTWLMVEGLKDGSFDETEFKNRYLALMRNRYKENRKTFLDLTQRSLEYNVALACYCPPETFCHRLLLVGILQKLQPGLIYMGEAVVIKDKEQLSLF